MFAPSLHGDGIRFAFFHHLWNKNRNREKEYGNGCRATHRKNESNVEASVQLRIPDTVIFRLGQPLQWYFTSERSGQASILRKRKQNVNVEKVEEVFLRKTKAANKGWLDSHNDIVAYFIASKECSRQRQSSDSNPEGECNYRNDDEDPEDEDIQGNNIEYFNGEGLRK